MEKYVVFGPMIIFMGIFALLIIGFFSIVLKLVFKTRKDVWTGELVDKSFTQKEDRENHKKIHTFYQLVFRTDAGEERKMPASKEMYDSYKIGDKAKKEKGALWPKKI